MAAPTGNTRKLVLKMSVSLDGFVSGPEGENDWIFRTSSPDSRQWVVETLQQAGAHMIGSRSYYDFAGFWPFSDLPFAAPMNAIPKIIVSRQGLDRSRLGKLTSALAEKQPGPGADILRSWAEPTVISGDLADDIRRLKAQPGGFILAHGGALFAQALAASGLVDEYRLAIHPVVLGKGKPLFSGLARPADLKLISATTFSSGAMAVVYQPA